MDRGPWRATVHEVTKSWIWLSKPMHTCVRKAAHVEWQFGRFFFSIRDSCHFYSRKKVISYHLNWVPESLRSLGGNPQRTRKWMLKRYVLHHEPSAPSWFYQYTLHLFNTFAAFPVYFKLSDLSEAAQSCLTLGNSMDCSPPGSSVHGILQARILEWVVMPSSRGSSWPRDQTRTSYISCIGRWVLYQ